MTGRLFRDGKTEGSNSTDPRAENIVREKNLHCETGEAML